MLKRRIALVGVVVIVAGLGAAPAAWADNTGPSKPGGPLRSGDLDPGPGAAVCHDYPGAVVFNKNGIHGSPDPSFNCLD